MDEPETLSAFGYEALAQNAAFHCRYVPEPSSREPIAEPDPDEVPAKRNKHSNIDAMTNEDAERKLLELAAVSSESVRGFRSLFPSSGTAITFHASCIALSWTRDELAFRNVTNFIKFVNIVQPRIRRVDFVESNFSRTEIIKIAKTIRGDEQPENLLIDNQTYLCFKQTGSDNLYATLVDELAPRVRRIEIDDEFILHLMQATNDFDYVKVVVLRRLEMAYLKSYFKIQTHELDIHRVATLTQVLEFDFDLFRMKINPRIEALCLLLDTTTTPKQTDEFNAYIRRLTPNLKTLTLVVGVGLNFSADHFLDALNKRIHEFSSTFAPAISNCLDEKFRVDFRLELSAYTSGKLREQKFEDWLSVLERSYAAEKPRKVRTELDSCALVFQLDGPRAESKITIRVHPIVGDYLHDEVPMFPHGEPVLVQ